MGAWLFGWIEIIFFYGIAIGFGLWQYFSVSRELEKTRAERLEREAKEAVEAEKAAAGAPGDDTANAGNAASDTAA